VAQTEGNATKMWNWSSELSDFGFSEVGGLKLPGLEKPEIDGNDSLRWLEECKHIAKKMFDNHQR